MPFGGVIFGERAKSCVQKAARFNVGRFGRRAESKQHEQHGRNTLRVVVLRSYQTGNTTQRGYMTRCVCCLVAGSNRCQSAKICTDWEKGRRHD